MRLLLIRHGQTPSNVEGSLDTRIPGPGLTPLGHAQAEAIPLTLANERIDAIYASVQVRSQITAAPLAAHHGVQVQIRAGIREISSGDYEMRRDRDAVEAYLTTMLTWAAGHLELPMPGGETGVEIFERFDEVVAEAHAAGHSTVAFVSHGAVIRTWVGHRASNVTAEYVGENPLHNTGVVVLEGSPETGWTVLTYMGEALGGPEVDDASHDGPAAETV
ncbi:MAG TPA: histidine phosphatase family protein [Glaciihabitans sp.]|jgi:probable phosphoglycerate mutase|nr:histidine phosphatase family protein [Glaciihabitans sp.]